MGLSVGWKTYMSHMMYKGKGGKKKEHRGNYIGIFIS
jgi:hypothetical protein